MDFPLMGAQEEDGDGHRLRAGGLCAPQLPHHRDLGQLREEEPTLPRCDAPTAAEA